MHSGFNVIVSLVLSLIIAMGIGFLNGFMVVRSGLPSFIITLGTFFMLRGFNLWLTQRVTGQTQVTGIEDEPGYEFGARCSPPTCSTIAGRVQRGDPVVRRHDDHRCVGAVRSKVGNWIFAVGGNKEAARPSACRPTPQDRPVRRRRPVRLPAPAP